MRPQSVVVLGDDDIRLQIREALRGVPDVAIVGELCAIEPRHVRYLSEVQPDVVLLDGASRTLNPLVAAADIRTLAPRPRLILVLPDNEFVDLRALSRFGAEAVVTTHQALRDAVIAPARQDIQPELSVEEAA